MRGGEEQETQQGEVEKGGARSVHRGTARAGRELELDHRVRSNSKGSPDPHTRPEVLEEGSRGHTLSRRGTNACVAYAREGIRGRVCPFPSRADGKEYMADFACQKKYWTSV